MSTTDIEPDTEAAASTSTDASGKTSLLVRQTSSTDADATELVQPLTYLQLGAYPTWGTDAQRGDDLLAAVGLSATTESFFADDLRSANAQGAPGTTYARADGVETKAATAAALTGELLTRGGIRLHTDGNFVSTTRGDRVDVVFGNHKLAVLGRTGAAAASWESSGGHAVRDDLSHDRRVTQVKWNATRATHQVFTETLKADRTVRFQGPLEWVFRGDSLVETLGPDLDAVDAGAPYRTYYGTGNELQMVDTDAKPIAPSASRSAHEQTDADTSWINPPTGAGTGWPRPERAPDVSEHVRATAFTERTKVRATLGAAEDAGTVRVARDASERVIQTHTAGATHHDVITAASGAKVTEARGFRGELLGDDGDGEDGKLESVWRMELTLGDYRYQLFETKHDVETGGAWYLQNTIADLVVARTRVSFGARTEGPDFSAVSHPSFTTGAFYEGSSWKSTDAIGLATGTLLFGTSDTAVKIGVTSLEFSGPRASVAISPYKSRVSLDHVEAHPIGARTEIGLGSAVASLFEHVLEAVRKDSGVVHISMNGLKVKS